MKFDLQRRFLWCVLIVSFLVQGCSTVRHEAPSGQTQLLIDRGVAFLELGQFDLAEASFYMAVDHQPTPEGYDGLVCTYLRSGRYERAKEVLDDIADWFPQYPLLHNRFAYYYDQTGNGELAAEHYQAALRTDGADSEARNNLAAVSVDQGGNFSKKIAKQYIEEAIVLHPHPIALHNLATLRGMSHE
jgi:Tfp pilus assembly protein PilF